MEANNPAQLEAQSAMNEPACLFVTYGQWKDGIFDCCSPGTKTTFWMALFGPCCWPCLFAKIASRLRWTTGLTMFGNTPFKQWLRILSLFFALMWVLNIITTWMDIKISQEINEYMWNHHNDKTAQPPDFAYIDGKDNLDAILSLCGILLTILICMLRLRTRTKFVIPSTFDSDGQRPSCMGYLEDFCCAWWCSACALAQMARHTYAAPDSGGCDPFHDPGPAETMRPQEMLHMQGRQHASQMQVFNVTYGQPNAMYEIPMAVPVATPVVQLVPVHMQNNSHEIQQGRPVEPSAPPAPVCEGEKASL